ncbi:Putative TonB dependent Vitamin B12 outer membrane receptor [Parvularcula bermudensis HTCC2503]|uniref:Putative TonB dependent Vitamin B12 outer membrane receptor n=1 Tax=Parvularcula bermudensis (strain ATCC BAA-594 / HTCC2503 / KCTC 12087) TaxID=314260 RepID=E0TCH3_PARBH|nr:TonB-dependent receptor [Parvularcula bermudensis]ADM10329.1 Putative TonB dependent Vitamin B12 outer membrane receptor [Parvularcula bermudensis HTCC2503]
MGLSAWALSGALAVVGNQPQGDGRDQAEEDIIIVDGTRLPQSLAETGTAISVLDRTDLERRQSPFLVEALAAQPGVTVNTNGAFGGTASVRLRGAASAQTLLVIDGLPVNDTAAPAGGYDFSRLGTAGIKTVEVLKGPQSVLWGADAIGGVVLVNTVTPRREGISGTVGAELGSFATRSGMVDLELGGSSGGLALIGNALTTDGISKADEAAGNEESDGFHRAQWLIKGDVDLGAHATLTGSFFGSEARTDLDRFDASAVGSVADGDDYDEAAEQGGQVRLNLGGDGHLFAHEFTLGTWRLSRDSFSGGQLSFSTEGERQLYRYLGKGKLGQRNRIALGVEQEKTSVETEDATTDSLFLLHEFRASDRLTLTIGGRIDDDSRFGSETTTRIAAAYDVTDALTLRGNWGEGIKAPSVFQTTYVCTFCGLTEPNDELRAERAEGTELGFDWDPAYFPATLSMTVFQQSFDDLIDFTFTDGYVNIDHVETVGGEAAVRLVPLPWLTVDGAYTFLDTEDEAGDLLIRLPRHSGDLALIGEGTGRLSGALFVRYNGEEQTVSGEDLPAWTRVDVTATYALTDDLVFYSRIENLFDEEYQQVLGYGTPGRSGFIGVKVEY